MPDLANSDAPNSNLQTGTVVARYHRSLDAWRGLLCLMVATHHTDWFSNTRMLPVIQNGAVLVDVFFVMSGFLMFEIYHSALVNYKDVKKFMWRRIARVYPLHFVTLMVMLGISLFQVGIHQTGFAEREPGEMLPFDPGAEESVSSLIGHLLLLNSMGLYQELSFNIPSWSVSVEFYCYLAFAAYMYFFPPRKVVHFVAMAVVVGLTYLWLSRVKIDMNFQTDLGFFRGAAGFVTGMLAAKVFLWMKPYVEKTPAARSKNIATVLEFAAAAALFLFVIYMPGKQQFWFAPFGFIFILVFAFGLGWFSDLLSFRPIVHLGHISYSVYLWHVPLLYVIGRCIDYVLVRKFGENWDRTYFAGDLFLIPYLVTVVFISHFSFKWIETACQNYMSGKRDRRESSPTPPQTKQIASARS